MVDAIRALLADPKEITCCFPSAHRSPAILRQIIERARLLADRHADHGDVMQSGITRPLIARVDVSQNKVLIAVDRRGLAASLEIDGDLADDLADPIIIERTVTLRRQGREQRLILTSASAETKPNPSMIKAIVRARRWFDMLKDRQVDSITDIGRRENAARAWISNQTPLAFLAPDITEAVIEGMQPVNLTLDRLIEIASASPRWTEQRVAFRAS
ncbi:hypothetical protein ACC764_29465 [Rhizobium ruizarguesonis]|uniref:hypothetical protein n=1 Tax=Rhizobium ruizarguesonis TaxID=2081791 RepID=UPI002E103D47|nr:hypothetical protein U8Q07_04660 [Rhizobium ruizarguesonis]WSH34609.1 hypothetical protein U8P70_04655 [Rhizobium ruizarguesonis]WSH58743.1 hypothetical protein U8P68_04625 [Rhizobium ruizarguesonis]